MRLAGVPALLRNEFRRNFRIQNGLQHAGDTVVEGAGFHRPPDEMLDQGFRNGRIYVVMRHMVADAVRGPSQRQFAQVAGAQHEAAVQVGQSEKMRGTRSGLHILERHVVHRFVVRKRMPDVAKCLHGGGPDVDLPGSNLQCLHERPRIRQRPVARGESGHRIGQNVFPGASQFVHGPGRHKQRLRRIESPRHPDHNAVDAGALQSLHQAMHLNVAGFLASGVQRGRIARYVRKPFYRAPQRDISLRNLEIEGYAPDCTYPVPVIACRVVKTGQAHPVLRQQFEVHIRQHHLPLRRKALRFCEKPPIFPDHAVPVPGQVRRGFARPCSRIEVRGNAFARLQRAQPAPVFRLADGAVACRQVSQHAGPTQRRIRTRRNRHPQVLA